MEIVGFVLTAASCPNLPTGTVITGTGTSTTVEIVKTDGNRVTTVTNTTHASATSKTTLQVSSRSFPTTPTSHSMDLTGTRTSVESSSPENAFRTHLCEHRLVPSKWATRPALPKGCGTSSPRSCRAIARHWCSSSGSGRAEQAPTATAESTRGRGEHVKSGDLMPARGDAPVGTGGDGYPPNTGASDFPTANK